MQGREGKRDRRRRKEWMEVPREAVQSNIIIECRRTCARSKSDIEEILYARRRSQLSLKSLQDFEGHDAADAPSVDVEHAHPGGRWFQVYREVGTGVANGTALQEIT